ncbi:MAG: signal recognition particle receptor subunit alpha [Candidatus Micrarchaeota archaeon]|nr:signal recognition particle receptor subunit alpha [Candidatus Micrarchaeota archaeon]
MDLGEGLRKAIARLSGATIIDAKSIKEFTKELQKALISSDVDINVVFSFTKKIEDAALKEKLPSGISPKDYITNMVYEELVGMMGDSYAPEIVPKRILLVGIYGSGKTTTAAKLAKFYQDRGLSAGLICCDISRPAAFEQLETLAKQSNVAFFGRKDEKDIRKTIRAGLEELKGRKVIICDSGGRNAMDAELAKELKLINDEFKPDEKMLVINADIGQVAGRQATEFDNRIKLTGVIVTKLDGSGKGGGALSAVSASKTSITFIGTGEKLNALEAYDSKKFVGRLLGMPDLESLVLKVQEAVKSANIKEDEADIENLSFDTFYKQLKAMQNVGPMKNILGMMGMSDVPKDVLETGETKLKKYGSIISSMTRKERNSDRLVKEHSRIARIAKGSGTTEKDVRELISDFNKMKKFATMFKNNRDLKKNISKFMPGM